MRTVILTSLVLVGIFMPQGKTFAALALLPGALIDRRKALIVLIALLVVRMSNTAITGHDPMAASAAWLTALAAASRLWFGFLMQRRYRTPRQLRPLTAYVIFVLLLSSVSLSPAVSTLKALAFFYIGGGILVGITSHAPENRTILAWLYAAWASILITSIAVLPFREIAYFRDGQGFQGSLNHPQGLGIFFAPLIAWSLAHLFGVGRFRFSGAVVVLLATSLLLLTRARTGIVSVLLGAVLLVLLRQGAVNAWIQWQFARRRSFVIVLPVILLVSPVVYPRFREKVMEFVFKSAATPKLGAAFEESRGFLIIQAMNNIATHPFTGIGFGVSHSETHDFNIATDPVTGLPIGAPTEKANLIVGVLEETGFIGLAVFVAFFIPFLRVIANSGSVALAWAGLTAISTNISEVTFFSMGGFGVYNWMICALAMAYAPARYLYRVRRRPRRSKGAHPQHTRFVHAAT